MKRIGILTLLAFVLSLSAVASTSNRHEDVERIQRSAQVFRSIMRSRGAFAGVSLNGAVVQPDDSGNAALYGSNVRTRQILAGYVNVPISAEPLIHVLTKYSGTETASAR
jgi:SH3 domain-containing YSC84-like protein 1